MYSEDHRARPERTAAPSEYVALEGQAPLSAETGQWLTDGDILCALKIEGLRMRGNLWPSATDIAPIREKEIPPEPQILLLLTGNSAPL